MSHVQEDHDEAFLPFVGIIIAELASATVVSGFVARVSKIQQAYCVLSFFCVPSTICPSNERAGIAKRSIPGLLGKIPVFDTSKCSRFLLE